MHAVYFLLNFVERPSWCYNRSCGDPADVLVSGLPVLSINASRLVEVGCLAGLLAELATKRAYRGRAGGWTLAKLALIFLISVDVFASFWGLHESSGLLPGETTRLAALLRPVLMLIYHKRLRQTAISIGHVLLAVQAPLALLFGLMLWFGMVSYVFMDQLCRPPACDQEAEFGDLPTSFMTILVLLTTANFPDLMMEAYTCKTPANPTECCD